MLLEEERQLLFGGLRWVIYTAEHAIIEVSEGCNLLHKSIHIGWYKYERFLPVLDGIWMTDDFNSTMSYRCLTLVLIFPIV